MSADRSVSWKRGSSHAAIVVFVVSLLSCAGQAAAGINRSLFYLQSGYGSIAWVKGAESESQAADMLQVVPLDHQRCIEVPNASLWFRINNREPEAAGQERYFGVTAWSTSPATPAGDTALTLHRNPGWAAETGPPTRLGRFDRRGDQTDLREFLNVESLTGMIPLADQHRVQFDSRVGGAWNARLASSGELSWKTRQFLARSWPDPAKTQLQYVGAYLLRHTVTNSSTGSDPVLFNIDVRRIGRRQFHLAWYAPNGGGNDSIILSANGPCPR